MSDPHDSDERLWSLWRLRSPRNRRRFVGLRLCRMRGTEAFWVLLLGGSLVAVERRL